MPVPVRLIDHKEPIQHEDPPCRDEPTDPTPKPNSHQLTSTKQRCCRNAQMFLQMTSTWDSHAHVWFTIETSMSEACIDQSKSSLQNYFSVAVSPRNTVQDCLLCRFPADLLTHIVTRVKCFLTEEFAASASKRQFWLGGLDEYWMEVSDAVYVSLLDLKLGLLSMMSSCYALYSKTRGMDCDWKTTESRMANYWMTINYYLFELWCSRFRWLRCESGTTLCLSHLCAAYSQQRSHHDLGLLRRNVSWQGHSVCCALSRAPIRLECNSNHLCDWIEAARRWILSDCAAEVRIRCLRSDSALRCAHAAWQDVPATAAESAVQVGWLLAATLLTHAHWGTWLWTDDTRACARHCSETELWREVFDRHSDWGSEFDGRAVFLWLRIRAASWSQSRLLRGFHWPDDRFWYGSN